MTRAPADFADEALALAFSISDEHDVALRWAARWKRAAKRGYSIEFERARLVASREAREYAVLRSAVLLTVGRLRGAAEMSEAMRDAPRTHAKLREWADQLERALAQEAGR